MAQGHFPERLVASVVQLFLIFLHQTRFHPVK